MGTTPNYSWPYPESSDYVADGATAIENLADAIDTTAHSFGTWTSYTPTITGGFTLGNGSIDFRYTTINKLVTVHGTILLGSTSAMPGGVPVVSLPVVQAQIVNQCLGFGQINDSGTATYPAWPLSFASGTVGIFTPIVTGSYIREQGFAATTPFTWTAGDSIQITLTYRAL